MRMLRVVFPVIAGLMLAVGQLPELFPACWLMGMAVAAMGFGNGVVFQVVSERFQDQIGMASGLIGAIGGVGGFLPPLWLGLLKDATRTDQNGVWLYAALAHLLPINPGPIMRTAHRAPGGPAAAWRLSPR